MHAIWTTYCKCLYADQCMLYRIIQKMVLKFLFFVSFYFVSFDEPSSNAAMSIHVDTLSHSDDTVDCLQVVSRFQIKR